MSSLIQNMVESSLHGVMRAYNEWLGARHHIMRNPINLPDAKGMVFSIDPTDKNYINWLVWSVHGFTAPDGSATVLRLRVEVSGTDVFNVEFEASGEYTIKDALAFSNIIMKDLHTELTAYTTREGWPSENINVY